LCPTLHAAGRVRRGALKVGRKVVGGAGGYPARVDPRTRRWIVPAILVLLIAVVVIGTLLG
jgi:hypothetical protein